MPKERIEDVTREEGKEIYRRLVGHWDAVNTARGVSRRIEARGTEFATNVGGPTNPVMSALRRKSAPFQRGSETTQRATFRT
jgi:hypothetical protein